MIVEEPRTGDVGLVKVEGFVGWLIDRAQRLNRANKKFAKYEHVLLCVGTDWALEGQPGGAVITRVSARYKDRPIVWVRPFPDLTDEEMAKVGNEASKLVGTPYSFLDYLALAIRRFNLPFPGVEKRVVSTKHMICSQIITEVFRRMGRDPFPGEPSGYVTPADYAVEFAK